MRSHYWMLFCVILGFTAAISFLVVQQRGSDTKSVATAPMHRAASPAVLEAMERPFLPATQPAREIVPEGALGPQLRLPQPSEPAAQIPPDLAAARAEIDEARRASEIRAKEHVAEVSANFSREIRDQRWSNEVGEALRTALASEELAGANVQAIDCRTKTCRLEFQDDGTGRLQGLIPMLALQMAGSLPNLIADYIEQPNGKIATVLYMSR